MTNDIPTQLYCVIHNIDPFQFYTETNRTKEDIYKYLQRLVSVARNKEELKVGLPSNLYSFIDSLHSFQNNNVPFSKYETMDALKKKYPDTYNEICVLLLNRLIDENQNT